MEVCNRNMNFSMYAHYRHNIIISYSLHRTNTIKCNQVQQLWLCTASVCALLDPEFPGSIPISRANTTIIFISQQNTNCCLSTVTVSVSNNQNIPCSIPSQAKIFEYFESVRTRRFLVQSLMLKISTKTSSIRKRFPGNPKGKGNHMLRIPLIFVSICRWMSLPWQLRTFRWSYFTIYLQWENQSKYSCPYSHWKR